jgi:hypothetical protein
MTVRYGTGTNREVDESAVSVRGFHGKRLFLWWLPIHLDKIQVRPD